MTPSQLTPAISHPRELARVLLVDDDDTSRLTLKAVLEASGYSVDAASGVTEALGMMDETQYELVLSDFDPETPESGLEVLAHARLMDYAPATAIVTSHQNGHSDHNQPLLIKPENLPALLSSVAELISQRAARIVELQMSRAAEARRCDYAVADRCRPIRSTVASYPSKLSRKK